MTRCGLQKITALTFIFALSASVVSAQSITVANDIITAESPLSDEQRKLVDKFVKIHIKEIVSGDPEKIRPSREKLLSPLKHPNATDSFKSDFGDVTVEALKPAIDSKIDLVRLNAFIVVANLSTPKVASACVTGVADTNPSVRYWATRAAASQKKDTFTSAQQQNKLADSLAKTLHNNRSADLSKYSYKALSTLSMPSAKKAIFEALNKRVAMQVNDKCKADLNDGIRADVEAIRTMIAKLNKEKFNGGNADEVRKQQMQLVRPVAKYLVLCAESLALGHLSDETQPLKQDLQPIAVDMADLADKLFNSLAKGKGIKGPPLAKMAKDPEKWINLYQNTLAWTGSKDTGKGLLSRLGIPLNQLTPCN